MDELECSKMGMCAFPTGQSVLDYLSIEGGNKQLWVNAGALVSGQDNVIALSVGPPRGSFTHSLSFSCCRWVYPTAVLSVRCFVIGAGVSTFGMERLFRDLSPVLQRCLCPQLLFRVF